MTSNFNLRQLYLSYIAINITADVKLITVFVELTLARRHNYVRAATNSIILSTVISTRQTSFSGLTGLGISRCSDN